MLRTNLSTRPFYNERAVYLSLGIVAALVLTLTLVNVLRIVELSRRNTELSTRIGRDRSEATRLTREAQRVRRGIDQQELAGIVSAAREANTLIDQRTFSWTALFNHLEATLPPDVMLTSIRPTVGGGGTKVTLSVLARNSEDIFEFTEKLEQTGAFRNVLNRRQTSMEDGLEQALLEAFYVQHPPGAKTPEGEAR